MKLKWEEKSFLRIIIVGFFIIYIMQSFSISRYKKSINRIQDTCLTLKEKVGMLEAELEKKPKLIAISRIEYGIASWYGRPEHGRKTYSGEVYDMHNPFTCAHPTLPMGTVIHVTNLKNKKSIVCRVNDRMPMMWLKKGRIVDISYAGAQNLGMVRDGLVPICLRVVNADEGIEAEDLHEYREIIKEIG